MRETIDIPVHFYLQNLDPGGAQPAMIGLANEFARRGIETHLIANTTTGFWRESVDPKITQHALEAPNSFSAVFRLSGFLRKKRPSVMLSAMTHANIVAVLARSISLSNVKVVISERHACSQWLAGLRRSRQIVFSRLVPLVYPRADGVITVANAAADDLSAVTKIPRARIRVIYNAAPDPHAIEGLLPPSHPWFRSPGHPLIVAAGRLEPQKDFATLLRAFEILRRNRRARLMILGEGGEHAELRALAQALHIADDVCLTGQVRSALPYMKHAALFVLSSKFEGFPNVLVEALACGTPVVSTDCESGPREILLNGTIGPLVPVGNALALSDAMAKTLDRPGDPDCRKARVADLTVGRTADAYLAVLRQVTAGHSG